MSGLVIGTGLKVAKGILGKQKKKGNLLGKAKAFASKLSETLGSEDDSLDATNEVNDSVILDDKQTKGLFGKESKKEKEAREAAEAEAAKKKNNMLLMGAVALILFMFMKKK